MPASPDHVSDNDDFGPDLFAGFDAVQLQQLELEAEQAMPVTGKRKRNGLIEEHASKRQAGGMDNPVSAGPPSTPDYGPDPFKDLNVNERIALEELLQNPGGDPRRGSDTPHTDSREGRAGIADHHDSDISEDSELEYVPLTSGVQLPFNVNITAAVPSRGREQIRHDTPIKPVQRLNQLRPGNAQHLWPPRNDLGIYSHNTKLSRNGYREILQKVGLSDELAYDIEIEFYNHITSPDRIPFMATSDDYSFRSGENEILPQCEIYVLAARTNGKPLYYPANQSLLNKTTDEERALLGMRETMDPEYVSRSGKSSDPFSENFAKLSADQHRKLIKTRTSRITDKYARIEFFTQRQNISDRFRKGKPSDFFNKMISDLSQNDRERLFQENAKRYPEMDIVRLRDRNSPRDLAISALEAMGLTWRYSQDIIPGWPLLLDARNSQRVFEEGRALRSTPTSQCLLVGTRNGPQYHRLNSHQARKLSETDRRHLGFVPSWTRTLRLSERYQLGLLPPGSQALETAIEDRELARYLGHQQKQLSHTTCDYPAIQSGRQSRGLQYRSVEEISASTSEGDNARTGPTARSARDNDRARAPTLGR